MTLHRLVPLLATAAIAAAPSVARAQIAEAAPPPPAGAPWLDVYLEATADRPEFAAQRADIRLQNAAEIVRQLGDVVARSDTTALGVTRLPELLERGQYPPPPYVARYVLRVRLAHRDDVQSVAAALSRAGAAEVWVRYPSNEPAR